MKKYLLVKTRVILLALLMIALPLLSTKLRADSGVCGGTTVGVPFMDVGNSAFFCQIAASYFSNLVEPASPTKFRPNAKVTRDELAVAVTRTQDSALQRGSKRAALNQWWTTTPHYDLNLGVTAIQSPLFVQSDGTDLWVTSDFLGTVSRVRASDGKLLETWTGATNAGTVLVAMGRVFVAGSSSPATLYMLDPSQPAGDVTTVAVTGADGAAGLAFDGNRIWIANDNAVSIITPGPTLPWSVVTVTTGFGDLGGMLYDGSNIWVTSDQAQAVLKLDAGGRIIQTVNVGQFPMKPVFDGTNLWVPNRNSNTVTVVRASTGDVVATLSGNGLNAPEQAAFDGERVLVTNPLGNTVSLWKATDLSPLGSFSTGKNSTPFGACSDGLNFWITVFSPDGVARF